jgi:hypothetical protein
MAKPKGPKQPINDPPITSLEAASNMPPATDTNSAQAQSGRKPSAKKPTIVRSEPRANLLPINLEDEIRQLAYLLSERRGFTPGHETEDWLAAEQEVRQRYQQHSA